MGKKIELMCELFFSKSTKAFTRIKSTNVGNKLNYVNKESARKQILEPQNLRIRDSTIYKYQ